MITEELINPESVHEMQISDLEEQPELVHHLLQEHEDSYHKMHNLTLRPMGFGLKSTFWLLRLYVLFMFVVVIINVVNTIH